MLLTIMRLQVAVTGIYGISFFFAPDFTLDTIFGWETTTSIARAVGAAFIVLAWIELNVTKKLSERLDLVWPFAALPALLLVGFLWEQAADTYDGSDLFFWVTVVVTLFFAIGITVGARKV
ncbi:MAG: hypothetical protein BMS9Abin12_0443 [Acidimicrobiia bacterium]|nr:MAG: hypothetical protein BMS9Abin12_0443 [Acidimicrobiia bacterium]